MNTVPTSSMPILTRKQSRLFTRWKQEEDDYINQSSLNLFQLLSQTLSILENSSRISSDDDNESNKRTDYVFYVHVIFSILQKTIERPSFRSNVSFNETIIDRYIIITSQIKERNLYLFQYMKYRFLSLYKKCQENINEYKNKEHILRSKLHSKLQKLERKSQQTHEQCGILFESVTEFMQCKKIDHHVFSTNALLLSNNITTCPLCAHRNQLKQIVFTNQ